MKSTYPIYATLLVALSCGCAILTGCGEEKKETVEATPPKNMGEKKMGDGKLGEFKSKDAAPIAPVDPAQAP